MLQPYRDVLARPGVRSLLLVTLLARIPVTAAPVALTLHVVLDQHLGFARSGVVAAMVAIGAALGAGAFWFVAVGLSYPALLMAAFGYGLLALPVFTLSRQSLAALLPPADRQAGFSLDSMSVEVSFAIGPWPS